MPTIKEERRRTRELKRTRCKRRRCFREIGSDRTWCARHVPRDLSRADQGFLRGWYVFGVPERGAPYEVLAHSKKEKPVKAFYEELQEEGRYGYELRKGYRSVIFTNDIHIFESPEQRQAIEDYLRSIDQGEDTLATVKQARRKAARKTKTKTKKTTRRAPGLDPRRNSCLCGCGEKVIRNFARGHHTRYRGKIVKAIKRAMEIGNTKREAKLREKLDEFGWSHFAPRRKKKTKR